MSSGRGAHTPPRPKYTNKSTESYRIIIPQYNESSGCILRPVLLRSMKVSCSGYRAYEYRVGGCNDAPFTADLRREAPRHHSLSNEELSIGICKPPIGQQQTQHLYCYATAPPLKASLSANLRTHRVRTISELDEASLRTQLQLAAHRRPAGTNLASTSLR